MKAAIRSSLAILLAAGGLIGASSAIAQAAGSDATLQRERAVCDGVLQDRTACLREAGAARHEARRGGLTSAAPINYEQNALARCTLQPPADRAACEQRVLGTGRTTMEGSVLGGGVIRETVTPIVSPMPMTAPPPAPMARPEPMTRPQPMTAPAPVTAPAPMAPLPLR
jgi:hypothetical protein